ncbi:MAG: hypothetical protein KDJ74_09940, partial [Notoacmeibacter sp.]|nr:hypothetical protein [Notoacmeibacter sp.]
MAISAQTAFQFSTVLSIALAKPLLSGFWLWCGAHRLTLWRKHGEGPRIPTTLLSELSGMATERYNPRTSEPKWQKAWDEA